MNCKIYLEIISIIWYNICSQGRNCPLSLVNIFAKANTSQEAPSSTSGSSSRKDVRQNYSFIYDVEN